MKKLFYFLITLSICLCFFSVLSLAAQPDDPSDATSTEANTVNEGQGEDDESKIDDARTSSVLIDSLYAAYKENKSDLFSLASAVVSIVLVLVYQRGLLPTVKGGLTLIEAQVKALREVSSEQKEQTAKATENTQALALDIVQGAQEMQKALEEMKARSASEEAREAMLARLQAALLWQAELLGKVFLHSSLPEYEKERVSNVIERVKATLTPKESEA